MIARSISTVRRSSGALSLRIARPRLSGGTNAAAMITVAFLAVVVVVMATTDALQAVAPLVLTLGLALLVPAAMATVRGKFDPLEPIHYFLAFFGYVYWFKPVTRLWRGDRFMFGEQNLDWAFGVALIGLSAFCVGYYSPLSRHLSARLPLLTRPVNRRRLRRCAWAFIVIGFAGLWAYMEASGGWRQFWSLPHGYGGNVESLTAYVYQLPELMVVGFFLLLFDVMTRRITTRAIVRVGVGSIGGVLIYTVLWSRRTFILWEILTGFVLYYLVRGRRPGTMVLVGVGVAMALTVTLAIAYRPYIHLNASASDFENVEIGRAARGLASEAGDEFDSYLSIVSLYPNRLEYDYFGIYGRILVHPIPRLIWPDKPPQFVSTWDDFLFLSGITSGASESVLGDLYIQLGTVGVIVGMLIVGLGWSVLWEYLKRLPKGAFSHVVYAVALGNMPSLVMQSGIAAFWKWMPFMIPGLLLAYRVSSIPVLRPADRR